MCNNNVREYFLFIIILAKKERKKRKGRRKNPKPKNYAISRVFQSRRNRAETIARDIHAYASCNETKIESVLHRKLTNLFARKFVRHGMETKGSCPWNKRRAGSTRACRNMVHLQQELIMSRTHSTPSLLLYSHIILL